MGLLVNSRSLDRQACKGLAMIEFTIVLPLLLIFFVTVVEFGILFYTHTTLNKAVENGSRFLAADMYNGMSQVVIEPTDVLAARNLVVFGNIAGTGSPLIEGMAITDVSVNCLYGGIPESGGISCVEQDSLTPIVVTAEVPYVPVLGGMMFSFLGIDLNLPLTAAAVNVTF